MALENQFQAHPNNSVSTTPLMVGFVFQPSMIDIFSYFLRQRLLVGQPILPPPYHTLVRDIDLYGEMSPEQIFDGDETEFYFFTTLKKQSESNKRVKRVAGGGTWDGDRFEDCKMVVQGNMTKVGTKRSFKYKKNGRNNNNSISWILHEYKMDKDYFVKTCNNDYNINPNIVENIVFCHVHKKVEKNYVEMPKKRKESFNNCEEQRKRICNDNLENRNLLLDNNNESSTPKRDNNNVNNPPMERIQISSDDEIPPMERIEISSDDEDLQAILNVLTFHNNNNNNDNVNNQPIMERIEISSDDEGLQTILNVLTSDDDDNNNNNNNNNNNYNVHNPPMERIEISSGDEDIQMILNALTFEDDDISWEPIYLPSSS